MFSVQKYFEWKKQRKLTLIGFFLNNIICGIDLSITLSTLLPYLTDNIKTKHPDMYFAFITTAFPFSSAVFGILSGRYVDSTRRMKIFANVTLIFQIAGNLLYLVSLSPIFPLIGRFLAGAGPAFVSVCIGEVFRI